MAWLQLVMVVVVVVVMVKVDKVVPQAVSGYSPHVCAEQQPEEHYHAAVETSCKKYYACAPGFFAAIMSCPDDTLFDDLLKLCNYASRVDCGTRPRPPEKNRLNPGIRPALRINAEPALYQLVMTEPFTSSRLDESSCQQMRQSILDQLSDMADCGGDGDGDGDGEDDHECSMPEVLCKPVDDSSPAQEQPSVW